MIRSKCRTCNHLIAWVIASDLGRLGGWGLVIGRTVAFDGPANVVPNFFWLINKFIAIEESGNRLQNSARKLRLSAVDSFISLTNVTNHNFVSKRSKQCVMENLYRSNKRIIGCQHHIYIRERKREDFLDSGKKYWGFRRKIKEGLP